jgi:hypothetical protein
MTRQTEHVGEGLQSELPRRQREEDLSLRPAQTKVVRSYLKREIKIKGLGHSSSGRI